MAAVAAILANQLVTVRELLSRRIGELLARFQLDDVVVALQAAALLEPLGPHGIDPVVVVEPAVFAGPVLTLSWIIGPVVGHVRDPLEGRGVSLAVVADRAAERPHRVRARVADEQ